MTIANTQVLSTSVIKDEGIPYISIFRLSAAGIAKGASYDPDEVVVGTGTVYNAIVLNRAMTAVPGTPTYVKGATRGGGSVGPTIELGQDTRGDETITFAMDNLQLNALIRNVTMDDSSPGMLITADNPQQKLFGRYGVIISSYVSGDDGISGEYKNRCILNAGLTITQKRGESQEGGVNVQSTIITISKDDGIRMPWGVLISATALGVKGDVTDEITIMSRAPLTISSHVGLAADVGWTLPFLPLSAEVADVFNRASKDGVTDNLTSISVSTGVIVTAAMADQEVWSVLYPTLFDTV
ncbi:hypothetical protein LCGC14_2155750 [marine sediment metagenome]|uniref:Uncharacterized protein n=1 Tax=marine sediment metagenome TaxID=412755 RepID=A0A0F9G7B0_9ZZZZ